ncbi:uncharacterized protein [Aegilops tauschii subsp. strangulata]|uniref:uncharacterized protein n=1 Tax=Aegilops tauschii subsp. strangulata TaxID=200361 RepID=UPI003CC87AB4
MAEEPSAKLQRGDMSDKTSKVDDVQVDLHGKEMMEVICTSNPDEADEMIRRVRMRRSSLYPSFIGVNVEFTREDEPPQRVAVLQFCVEPKRLDALLKKEKLYTFVGFSIEGDKQMLKNSRKKYDSLADVASILVHPFYSNMKKKINKEEDHKLWGISPSPEVLIKYVAIDAYATYESWKKIDNIKQGLDRAKEEEENPYYHYDF